MSDWKELKRTDVDSVELTVKERTDWRNHLGAMEYMVEARIDGELMLTERHPQSVWLGHCYGQLLLPEIALRAKTVKLGW